jgi:phosphate transport system permease protein
MTSSRRSSSSPLSSDRLLLWALRAAASLAAVIVVLISLFLAVESWPALRTVGIARFFSDPSWYPARGGAAARFNLVPIIVGSLATTIGALVIAGPLGIASAIFSVFYAPVVVAVAYRRLIELLAGIPSVVYGFWGLIVLAPIVRQWQPPGQSLLAGMLILALMILPTVALLSEAGLRSVPREYLLGASALGLSRWATIWGVAIPAARGSIATALILATARAIGETMAVLMVSGNVVQLPGSVFDPIRTLTANIALELGYALDLHRSALFVTGLLLMIVVVVLVFVGDALSRTRARARLS